MPQNFSLSFAPFFSHILCLLKETYLEDVAAFIVTAQNDLSCLSVRKSQQFAVQCWNAYADIF